MLDLFGGNRSVRRNKTEGTEEWKRVESVPEIWNLIPLYNYRCHVGQNYGQMSISAIVKDLSKKNGDEFYGN